MSFSEDFAKYFLLQKDLSLLDKPANSGTYNLNARGLQHPAVHKDASLISHTAPPPPRNAQPMRSGTLPPPGHRPAGSEERRAPPRPPRGPNSPSKRDYQPRQRGMSESSAMGEKERRDRMERTESEERRRRERRREREERHRREKEKDKGKKMKKPQGLDIIDKLDVTGIYGQGCKLRSASM